MVSRLTLMRLSPASRRRAPWGEEDAVRRQPDVFNPRNRREFLDNPGRSRRTSGSPPVSRIF